MTAARLPQTLSPESHAQPEPGPVFESHPHGLAAFALIVVFAAGAMASLQIFLNGQLAQSVGSPVLAGCVNQFTGLAGLIAICVVRGVPARAKVSLKLATRPRWWHLVAGVNGGLLITVASYAAPRVGVALLTVALVCGQVTGSLAADRAGMSPAGLRLLTPARVVGVGLAIVAVSLGALGAHGEPRPGLLALVMLVGIGNAVQQAAMGHMAKATGEPLAAGVLNIGMGAIAILIIALIVTGGSAPGSWSAPPEQWLGGILGATVAVLAASATRRFGVLTMMLALVAGQSAGGLMLDIVAPPPGEVITMLTVVSVLLTLAAVVVSSVAPRSGNMRISRAFRPGT